MPRSPAQMSQLFLLSFISLIVSKAFCLGLLERQSSNCTEECAESLNATLSCATAPDPFCGCSDFLAGAPSCKECLTGNNVTLVGFFNSTYVEFIQAVCHCQRPSCGNLTQAEKECTVENSTDPFCTCPATQKYAPDCYACLKQQTNDPIIVSGFNARESICNVSSPSASASAFSSASSVPTFTSEGPLTGIPLGWIGVVVLLTGLVQ